MTTQASNSGSLRKRLLAAVASVAVAGAIGFGAVTSGSLPSYAEAVRVESGQTMGFADVVERVSPAVVSVRVASAVQPASDSGGTFGFPGLDNLPEDHPMQRFFREFRGDQRFGNPGQPPRSRERAERARPSSQGSGFFVSEDGYLVTNNHVIQGGSEFIVVMDDGTELSATLVGSDPRTDLAVLKVEEDREFTYVAFADDAQVRVGDWVVAVGNPFGLGGTVTAGIVSARGRDIGAGPYDDFIQIDAAVNRGNSGGPAFNLNGEVVGVNTAIFSPSGGNVGIAFAIPASLANDVVDSLIQNGQVSRGWLGIQIQPVSEDIAESVGLDKAAGALVTEAQADGPALDAGVKAGDIVTQVNGRAVASPRELARLIGSIQPGTDVELTIWRNGSEEKLTMELAEMPGDQQQAAVPTPAPAPSVDENALTGFGLTVAPADDGEGLVVTDVDPESAAAERGIQVGDVIRTVNGASIASADDVTSAVDEASQAGRRAVLVQVERDDNNLFVALPVQPS
jgi:serine protease Do